MGRDLKRVLNHIPPGERIACLIVMRRKRKRTEYKKLIKAIKKATKAGNTPPEKRVIEQRTNISVEAYYRKHVSIAFAFISNRYLR